MYRVSRLVVLNPDYTLESPGGGGAGRSSKTIIWNSRGDARELPSFPGDSSVQPDKNHPHTPHMVSLHFE